MTRQEFYECTFIYAKLRGLVEDCIYNILLEIAADPSLASSYKDTLKFCKDFICYMDQVVWINLKQNI